MSLFLDSIIADLWGLARRKFLLDKFPSSSSHEPGVKLLGVPKVTLSVSGKLSPSTDIYH